jgi:hypothetical protein
VPMGIVYFAACLLLAGRFLAVGERRAAQGDLLSMEEGRT